MNQKSPITTHILDTACGCPAAGIAVKLEFLGENGAWQSCGAGTTNSDGRITDLIGPGSLTAGMYRLTFATAHYFQQLGGAVFFPEVQITFVVSSTTDHYHVPLLLSPFGYSTYRGS